MNLEKLLRQFEDPELEFKEALPSSSKLAQTAAAFANGRGGKFIFGVRDEDRVVVGIDPDAVLELEQRITSIIADTVCPQMSPVFTTVAHEGKILLVVHIVPGSLKPYHICADGPRDGTYIRIGSQTRKADGPAVRDLELQRQNLTLDQTTIHGHGPEAIDPERAADFITKRVTIRNLQPSKPDQAFLVAMGALRDVDGRIEPTVAGILMLGRHPQATFPYARVKCARFKGTEMDEFLDQRDAEGTLPEQVETVMAFFRANVARSAVIEGTTRKERYAWPEVAVREAVVNAICHRDYGIEGSDVKFAMFDDRIEVTSPGGLPSRITTLLLGTGVSEARNRIVAKLLREQGLVEEWGSGTVRMRKTMHAHGLAAPVFIDQGGFFKVILPGAAMGQVDLARPLDAKSHQLLMLARAEGRISTGQGMEATGLSRPAVIRKLSNLQELGLLEWRGSAPKDPTGHYVPATGGRT
jgi:ATP-dependent DNA helicase RecG